MPTGVPVALKVLHPEFASDPTLSARFRREAAALATLRDPHTVHTYEHGQAADGTLYISLELLTGRSLQAELRSEGPLPWWRMLSIMRGVCSSLMEAHALGIVHRDLKPANIHLERRSGKTDFVKVLDFGIVKVLSKSGIDDGSDITRVGQAVGTLDYMSPEQIIGSDTDHRTDLYTLGVVAYEMITGRRPFADAAGPTSLMTSLMTRTPTPPSALFHRDCFPAAVDRLILRCLARDPQDRYADASELVDAIDEVLLLGATGGVASAGMHMTLPGSGPAPRAPRRPAPDAGAPMSMSQEIDEVTTVDIAPLFAAWEPSVEAPVAKRLARTPNLDAPPAPPKFTPARGSTVSVAPQPPKAKPTQAVKATQAVKTTQMVPIAPVAAPARAGTLRLAVWGLTLLASGIGLGAIVASLA